MEEDTPPDIFQQLSDLAEVKSEFEEQWEAIYKDCGYLYHIRLKYPDDFHQISRISLDDREHATECGQHIFDGLIEKLTNEHDSKSIDQAQKRLIRKWRNELQTNVHNSPYDCLEKIQLKLNEETAIYLPFAEPKDSSVEPETSPTNVQKQPGMCIILADKNIKDDAKTFKELFTYLGYETKQIEGEKDRESTLVIQDHLKANTSVNDRSAVVIVIDVGCGDMTDLINGYQQVFDGADKLKDKPKILITHFYDGELGKLHQPADNILHIVSHIKNDDPGACLFIQSLDAVFRNYQSMYDIYELLTKVLRDVEIPQHITWRNFTDKPEKYPYHSVIFKTSLKSPFRLNITKTDIPDDPIPSSTGVFSMLPGQYTKLERISKYDLKKVFSVDIDLKLTRTLRKHHYRMDRKPRGLCVIVNMSNDRSGSLVDEVKMAQLFEELYFDVRIINNRTHEEIEQETGALASVISDLHQCVVVFLMGHGTSIDSKHHFADVTSTLKSSDYVLDVFKNQKHLIVKPKLFIIQTCFGVQTMRGLYAEKLEKDAVGYEEASSAKIKKEEPFAVHKDSDTIKLNATLEDYMSFRMSLEGSYLIQGVDQILREYSADKDVTQMMTLIKNKVLHLGKERESLQQAKVEDVLNLHLYLNPGYSVSEHLPLPDMSTCKQVCVEGSIVWTAGPGVACVADRCNTWIKLVNVDLNETSVHVPEDLGYVSGILSGVSVRCTDDSYPNEHVIVVKALSGHIVVLLVSLIDKTWRKLTSLFSRVISSIPERSNTQEMSESLPKENLTDDPGVTWESECEPLTLCAVNDDAFAILWGKRGSAESMIHVFSCDDIHNSDGRHDVRLKFRCKTQDEASRKLNLGIRDTMCYSNAKFYISCFSMSSIFQFDIQGNIEQCFGEAAAEPGMKTPGSLHRPCGLFTYTRDSSERIMIACYDGIHQANVIQNSDGTLTRAWSDVLPFDRAHGMWYNNGAVLTVIDCLDYTFSSIPNVEVSSSTTLTPNHTKKINSQLVQTVWPTSDPDTVTVGSAESAHIFLLRSDGELLGTRFIDIEARVMSGINVFGNTHLTILHDDNKSYLYKVELTKGNEKSVFNGDQKINGNTNPDVTYITCEEEHSEFQPISLVTVDGDHYGLLGRQEAHTGRKNTAVIKLYNRKTLKHKKTMVLDDIDVGVNDRVCVDMNGFYIISSYGKKRIYTFDVDGTMLAEIDTPGENPCSVMVDEKNNLLVQCENSLHKYMQTQNRDSESATSDWKTIIDKPSWDVCYSGQNLYTVYRNTLSVYQTDNHIHSSTSCKGEIVTSEHKNPPLLKFANRAILEGDQIQKYQYPPLWPTTSFKSVTSDRSIDIGDTLCTCWSAGDNDSIIVGGWNEHNQPTVSLVTATGRYITHVLSCGRYVISGLLVKMLLHIVCVTYVDTWLKNTSNNKLHLITLDHTSIDSSIIRPLITLDVTNPVYVFRKSTQLCGALCMDGSYPNYTHGRIRLLGLDQLILPTCTNPRTLQSTARWGRRTLLHLDLPKPHPWDTVAVTSRGQYCIASYERHEILVYSNTGVYMYSVGEESYTSHPGVMFETASVQCTADNCVIVTRLIGDIQMYNMSSETGELMRRKHDGGKYRKVKDDDSDDEEYDKDGRRKVYYYKDDPDGWRIVRRRDESRLVLHSALTSSCVWEIVNSDEHRIHVSNIIK